jgi:hypothetical protein
MASAPAMTQVEAKSDEDRPVDDCDYHGCFFCSGPETD